MKQVPAPDAYAGGKRAVGKFVAPGRNSRQFCASCEGKLFRRPIRDSNFTEFIESLSKGIRE